MRVYNYIDMIIIYILYILINILISYNMRRIIMTKKIEPRMAQAFIDSLDAMAVVNTKGEYVYVNKGWIKYSGYQYDEVIGKRVWDFFTGTYVQDVLRTGKPILARNVLYHGKISLVSYYPFFSDEGNLEGCFIHNKIEGIEEILRLQKRIDVLSSELSYYKSELSKERETKYSIENIIGSSKIMQNLRSMIINAARSMSSVLIEGETGCGKELIAHAIHNKSKRNHNKFVTVNCSAIPAELMESEFFGYTAGSFTGALKNGKQGRFKLADKGTLFLDEVNLLSPTIQPKFLRVLQEKEIEPIGSGICQPIDVRIIAASNLPLEKLVASGDFREDLFYRLNVIRIEAPPLRTHKEDIPEIADSIIQKLNEQLDLTVEGIEPDMTDLLLNYDWPGNVRELSNYIESAMNMAESSLLNKRDFSQFFNRVYSTNQNRHYGKATLKKSIEIYERQIITDMLDLEDNNRAKVAKRLGISRTQLYQKMNKYGLI